MQNVQSAPLVVKSPGWGAAWTLAVREWKRFLRQPHRIIGSVAQPILFWVLLGLGFSRSFNMGSGGVGYGEYFIPGVLAMILLFTAIFSTISIIEDRNEGFLQSVLVAPCPRWSMVLGKVLGGSTLALLQAGLFAVLGFAWSQQIPGFWSGIQLIVMAALIAGALTSLGFVMAWRLDSTQGFHALMSVFLFPMWLLSGSAFPVDSPWLRWIAAINPLSYGVAGMRRLIYAGIPPILQDAAVPNHLPSLPICWLVVSLFAACMFAAAIRVTQVRVAGDLK